MAVITSRVRLARGGAPPNWSQVRAAYLMVGGALLIVGVFTIYPYAYALWASLQNLSPIMPPSFAGLKNYSDVLNGVYFGRAVLITLTFTFICVPLILALGVGVASLLNQRFLGNSLLKAILLLPWAIPAAITGVIWKGMFNDSWGAVNAVLYAAGIIRDYLPWLSTAFLATNVAVLAQVWTQFPLAALLLLAAMQAIPQEQYESAAIDGASVWQRFLHVTWPGIRGTLVILALYQVLVGLTTFDLIFSLTGGGPGTATTVIGYFIWSETFKMLSFGRGAALAVILALTSIVVILMLMRTLPRDAFLSQRSS